MVCGTIGIKNAQSAVGNSLNSRQSLGLEELTDKFDRVAQLSLWLQNPEILVEETARVQP